MAVSVSVLALGEAMTPPQAAGGALILSFTLWNETSAKQSGMKGEETRD